MERTRTEIPPRWNLGAGPSGVPTHVRPIPHMSAEHHPCSLSSGRGRDIRPDGGIPGTVRDESAQDRRTGNRVIL
jgi:hypothetical protein